MWMTSCTGSVRKGFGGFEKSQLVEFERWKKTVDFRSSPRPCGRCRTWFGADGKVSIERWYLSPYVEKPLKSKVIKSFVPELRSRKCFSCFGIPMLYVRYGHYERFAYRYELSNYISHIHVWLCNISILSDLHNAVVGMVSIWPLISKSSNPLCSALIFVSCKLISIGITVTFKFHNLFSSPAWPRYLSLFFLSFNFTPLSSGTEKSIILNFFGLSLGLVIWPRLCDLFVSQKPKELCISYSRVFYHIYQPLRSGRIWHNVNF